MFFAVFRAFHWWTIPAGVAAGIAFTGFGALFLRWSDRWHDSDMKGRDDDLAKLFRVPTDEAKSSVLKWLARQPDRDHVDPATRDRWPSDWHETLDAVGQISGIGAQIDFKQPIAKARQRPGFLRIGASYHEPELEYWVEPVGGQVFLWEQGHPENAHPEYPTLWHFLMDEGCRDR
jgi:hypothetical protein